MALTTKDSTLMMFPTAKESTSGRMEISTRVCGARATSTARVKNHKLEFSLGKLMLLNQFYLDFAWCTKKHRKTISFYLNSLWRKCWSKGIALILCLKSVVSLFQPSEKSTNIKNISSILLNIWSNGITYKKESQWSVIVTNYKNNILQNWLNLF